MDDCNHLPSFKAAVALAAHKADRTAQELADRYGISPDQVEQWHQELLEHAARAFPETRPENAGAADVLFGNKELALTIAENSTLGFAMMDADGFCIYVNRAWLDMTGYTAEDFRNTTLHDLVHHHHPDGRPYPRSDCPIGRALPERYDVRAHEDLFFRKDGTTFPVICAASPIFEKGKPVATIVEIRDLTAQKQTEERERRSNEALRASAEANAKFRTFFEQGSYFGAVVTVDGTLVEVNRFSLDTSGFEREEVVGRKFWDCGWWNRSPLLMEAVRHGIAEAAAGRVFRQETPYYVRDGKMRVIDLSISPVTDESGQVLFIAPTGVDVTERKAYEERLRFLDAASEATRAAQNPKTVMDITTRLLAQYLQVTRCAYADVERDNDRFTIRHDWSADGFESSVGVYSLDLFGSQAAEAMRGGQTLVVKDVDRELPDSDGGAMFNAIGIKAIVCCPLVKDGHLVAMMAVHQAEPRQWTADEIALVKEMVERSWAHIERIRAAEALRRSEAHFASLFAQTAAGIAETDSTGRLLVVNDRYCQMLQRPREELVGRKMQELTHPDDLQHNLPLFENMIRTGEPFEIEKRYLLPNGGCIWVSNTVSLIRAADGETIDNVLAVVLDITERKRVEEQLKEADRRKDEFLAMLAHELRNPLAPISAAAELQRRLDHRDPQIERTSEIIARQVRHLTELVDDLLDVSRVTRGLIALDKTEMDIRDIVTDALEQVGPYLERRRHRLTLEHADTPARVSADKKRMVQVMVNLLNNAAKYTPEGGHIRLEVQSDAESVHLTVEDNGVGMTPELTKQAFDLFTQAERSIDRSQGGLGIGLALAKRLTELHDGTIAGFSKGLGQGSRFTVTLPRVDSGSKPGKLSSSLTPERGLTAGQLEIMVVDDNVDAADSLAQVLTLLGHTVQVEYDSSAALKRAEENAPDVFLLDIGLPKMDGKELARRLHAQASTGNAVFIAITGYGQIPNPISSPNADFHHHLVKPVDLSRLSELLRDIAAQRTR